MENFIRQQKKISYNGYIDKRLNNSNTRGDMAGNNIDDRTAKFGMKTFNQQRNSLYDSCQEFLQPRKDILSYMLAWNRNKKSALVGLPDAKIIFTNIPYVQYEQFRLNDNFRQYIETIMIFEGGYSKNSTTKSKWYELRISNF